MYIYVLHTYTFYKQDRLVGPTIAKVKKYLAFFKHIYISKLSRRTLIARTTSYALITHI